ncbi:beta-keto acid cleavage family enzyme [Roseixanthobacter pseudopolyaromaticivorans]|uniref:3-keto-5-aminohexanoate cleavage protein n=1 Tax=Xanthobacteraceae TaxID=335928 RepID=UPI003729C96C
MGRPLIIEVRVNEYAMRHSNPNVPWTPDEISRDCNEIREAGAAVVHFHARKEDGSPAFDAESYAASIRKIRAGSDILIAPTMGQIHVSGDATRFQHYVALEKMGLKPDFVPIDTGTTNIDRFDFSTNTFDTKHKVYLNTTETVERFIGWTHDLGMREQLFAWTVPMLRTGQALYRMGLLKTPVHQTFLLTEGGILGGHPGTVAGLKPFIELLDPAVPMIWSVGCKEGDLLGLVPYILQNGGHISIGLGDYGYRELGMPRNVDVVRKVVELARQYDRTPVTPDGVKELLGM